LIVYTSGMFDFTARTMWRVEIAKKNLFILDSKPCLEVPL